MTEYLRSVLTPLFPNFVSIAHDVNWSDTGEGGVGNAAKAER